MIMGGCAIGTVVSQRLNLQPITNTALVVDIGGVVRFRLDLLAQMPDIAPDIPHLISIFFTPDFRNQLFLCEYLSGSAGA